MKFFIGKAKCAHFFTPEQDGLRQAWGGTCWLNPPYGGEVGNWVRKAYESASRDSATVVCLLPARTDTRWWHEFCSQAEVRFVKGRVKFGDAKTGAPFPSAIVIFRKGINVEPTTQYCHLRETAAPNFEDEESLAPLTVSVVAGERCTAGASVRVFSIER
jgi:hypothetical protein